MPRIVLEVARSIQYSRLERANEFEKTMPLGHTAHCGTAPRAQSSLSGCLWGTGLTVGLAEKLLSGIHFTVLGHLTLTCECCEDPSEPCYCSNW